MAPLNHIETLPRREDFADYEAMTPISGGSAHTYLNVVTGGSKSNPFATEDVLVARALPVSKTEEAAQKTE